MNEAQHIVPRLKRLIELEKSRSHPRNDGALDDRLLAEIGSIRALLPTAILRHHDSRRLRGKKSLAPVTSGVCGACHLAIPSGRLADLRKIHNDLNVCNHCDVFIYLPEEDASLQRAESPAGPPLGPPRISRKPPVGKGALGR